MSIVTRKGDQGRTALMYNRQVSKCHPRVESYGAVDELNAALGFARTHFPESEQDRFRDIQKALVLLMGELATAPEDLERYTKDGFARLNGSQTTQLDSWVAEVEAGRPAFRGWATPGENARSAVLELARTACRRAERRVCALLETGELGNPEIIVYLNRLSDLLWLLARQAESQSEL